MKLIVLSDIHYIAESMIIDDKKSTIDRAAALQSIIDSSSSDYSDTILITGDLTDRGDKESHDEFLKVLREAKAKGKKIYVTTATHDFNHNGAYTTKRSPVTSMFASTPWGKPYFDKENADFSKYLKPEYKDLPKEKTDPQLVECYTPEELWDLYREFGRDQAYSVENGSFCYCIDLDENTRCLMLNDNFRNEEAMRDNSVGYTPACYKWIDKMVKEAKEQGKFIFACTHHPLLPPSPAYRIGAGGNRDMRSPYAAHTLADIGVNLVLTGHSHFSDVGFAESSNGNILCDITTPSVRHYPPRYRLVDLDGAAGRIAYRCVEVTKPEDVEIGYDSLEEYYFRQMYDEYSAKIANLKAPLNKIIGEMKVKNMYFLVKNIAKLSDDEYNGIKEMRIFDLIITAVFNMLTGDGKYTPDTAEYKVLMALATIGDSIIDTEPFIDIRKTVLKGYSLKQAFEPLCCNGYAPDNEGEIDFTVKPAYKYAPNVMKSFAGDYLMVLICLLVIPVSKLLPYAAVIGVPAMTIVKKLKSRKFDGPNYKY